MNTLAQRWLSAAAVSDELKQEIQEMTENQQTDAFYQHLAFGTGGMRGVLGAGTNRMNVMTVRRAAYGIATYIKKQGQEWMDRGFVIAFDNRRQSLEFSREVASVLAAFGITVYVYEEPRTTPQLSFSVRELGTAMGMMITASHNPPEYNGLKVYGEDGAQLNLEDAERLIEVISSVGEPEEFKGHSFEQGIKEGKIELVGKELDEKYQSAVHGVVFSAERLKSTDLRIVFTPLHGASGSTVQSISEHFGIPHFSYVSEQMTPDSEFPTVRSANPEEQDAFDYAIRQGEKEEADILIAVDPDGDRVGLAVKHNNRYQLLNGNETGALALDFILKQLQERNALPANGKVFKTIVTSEMGRVIAASYGIETEDVLTGFKFIGEKIRDNEHNAEFTFIFGYEESYGYLAHPFARDKDAVQMVFILSEMAAYYKQQGMTLFDALDALYQKHGVFKERLISVTVPGVAGAENIRKALAEVRMEPPLEIASTSVVKIEDYLSQVQKAYEIESPLTLPQADVIKIFLQDNTWICLRPSGTEPKIKYYVGATQDTVEAAERRVKEVGDWIEGWMKVKLSR